MSANSLYIAYEDYLIGRVPSLSTYYFYGSDPGGANEKVALQLIKYAIEKLLNWTVDTAVKRFDEYIIKQLKLERMLELPVFLLFYFTLHYTTCFLS